MISARSGVTGQELRQDQTGHHFLSSPSHDTMTRSARAGRRQHIQRARLLEGQALDRSGLLHCVYCVSRGWVLLKSAAWASALILPCPGLTVFTAGPEHSHIRVLVPWEAGSQEVLFLFTNATTEAPYI